MKFYNSLTSQLDEFNPIDPPNVRMYVCGITPYDSPHLGHARSAVAFDLIRKYLEFKGFHVKFIMNYTDVDDKIIQRANEKNITIGQLSQQYIDEYEKMQQYLRIKPPTVRPRATQEIPSMIELIKKLDAKGYTYTVEGSVYLDTSKVPNYISLFQNTGNRGDSIAEDILTDRFTQSEYIKEKRNTEDFVLWKKEKPGEPSWDSPWGKGRPGWHLECSAMSMRYLGDTIDIHGGGKDLKSPHHKNEIAQSESATGKKFCNIWIHNGFLTINSEKMSKSLGNFIPLMEILKKYPGTVMRFFFLSTYYQRPIDFSLESLDQATKNLEKIRRFIANVRDSKTIPSHAEDGSMEILAELEKFSTTFYEAMDDDLNTAKATAQLFSMINLIQKEYLTPQKAIPIGVQTKIIEFASKVDQFYCILEPEKVQIEDGGIWKDKLTVLIEAMLDYRKEVKKAKNYAMADKIRDLIQKAGIKLTDAGSDTTWELNR